MVNMILTFFCYIADENDTINEALGYYFTMCTSKKRGLLFYLLVPGAFILGCILIGVIYHVVTLNLWIHQTPAELEAYPFQLIVERQRAGQSEQSQNSTIADIEEVLVQQLTQDRIVINLSRSEIKFGLLGRKAYVKVYMETAVPEKPEEKRVRVKLLEVLRFHRGRWQLVSTYNLLIQ
ncbi:MAG: hypothetical protein N2246_00885 [Candidatus Sumerlaeia bacterium]|nr:hypothetical protein [Candidatus Sumerlaeia bacterium]